MTSYASVRIGQQDIPVHYKDMPRSARLSVRYCLKKHCLIASLPARMAKAKVLELIRVHKSYFERIISAHQKVVHGMSISIVGKKYSVCAQPSFRNYHEVKGDQIIIYHGEKVDCSVAVKSVARIALEGYLYRKVPVYTDLISEDFNRITVKDISSRWGSCSRKKNLNFSLNLAFAPLECIDYVVAHEVCHLKHMDHSARFWQLVEELCPTYREQRLRLKQVSLIC